LFDKSHIDPVEDSILVMDHPDLPGWLIGKDARHYAMAVVVDQDIGLHERRVLIDELERIIEPLGDRAHMAGYLNTEIQYIKLVELELTKAICIATAFIILILLVIYRSPSGVIIPTLAVILGMIYLYGILGMKGQTLDVMCTMLPTILVIVGISDIVHILTKYQGEMLLQRNPENALRKTMKEIWFTLLLTSLTTAAGFLALNAIPMKAIKAYGQNAALGVTLAFLTAVTFTPAMLSLTRGKKIRDVNPRDCRWQRIILSINRITLYHQKEVLWIAGILMLISGLGISRISNNNYLCGFSSGRTTFYKDFQYFDKHFSGVRSLEIAVIPRGGVSIHHPEVLQSIEKLETFLKGKYHTGNLYSLADLYKRLNSYTGSGVQLPTDSARISLLKGIAESFRPDIMNSLTGKEGKRTRIYGKMRDPGSQAVKEMIHETKLWMGDNLEPGLVDFRFTGTSLLLDQNNDNLVKNMMMSLLIAFLLITCIMIFLFRSWRMVVVSLIPNILPLIVVAAFLGFAGIPLSAPVSLIFTIGFVIAVDDTIHFLAKYKFELRKGMSHEEAISSTMKQTGKAIIITSIIIFSGYFLLVHSQLRDTQYHGLLIGTTILSALFSDLFILPILLRRLMVKPKKFHCR
jgi:predicted RND superfamily exporter protein